MPDPTTKIWKYMDFAKFLDLITHDRLFFANGNTLTDKLEGSVPDVILENKRKELRERGLTGRDFEEELSIFQHWEADSMLGLALFNCWSEGDDESFALWKVYLGGQNLGFAVQSRVGSLLESIEKGAESYSEDFYIGKVEYRDDWPAGNVHRLIRLTRKMPFYSYEDEIRLIILNYPRSEEGTRTPYPLNVGRHVAIDTSILIESVIASPFAPAWFYETVRQVVKKISPATYPKLQGSRIDDS